MDNIDKELSDKYCQRFGHLTVEMEFATEEQIKDALSQQVGDNLAKRPHRLLGRILLENGWITPQQIDTILNKLFKIER